MSDSQNQESKKPSFSGTILNFSDAFRQRFSQTFTQTLNQTLSVLPKPQDIEKKVDEGVQKTLALLNIPTREEVSQLQNQIDQLIDRCDHLLQDEHLEDDANKPGGVV